MGRVKIPKIQQYEAERCTVVKCPVCGKKYVPAPMHVYKMPNKDGKRVCSYTCMLKAEREKEAKMKKRGPKPKDRG